jgi:hypothetical protein
MASGESNRWWLKDPDSHITSRATFLWQHYSEEVVKHWGAQFYRILRHVVDSPENPQPYVPLLMPAEFDAESRDINYVVHNLPAYLEYHLDHTARTVTVISCDIYKAALDDEGLLP